MTDLGSNPAPLLAGKGFELVGELPVGTFPPDGLFLENSPFSMTGPLSL